MKTSTSNFTHEIPTADLRPRTWIRLAEYGDWPHPQGLQRFTHESAGEIVRYFKSIRGRLARKFGGLPVFIGHPDDEHFAGQSGHTDTRAYAWIVSLEAREDGLYGLPKWSAAGKDLLRNAFYKHVSPRWAMRPGDDGTFAPVRLISIGLTNHPNIPGDVIANQDSPLRFDVREGDWFPSGTPAPAASGLKTVSCTSALGGRGAFGNSGDFLSHVNERVERTGEAFAQAWANAKQERPDLFHEFNTF